MSSSARYRVGRRFRRCTVRVRVDYRTPSGVRSGIATTLGAGGLFIPTQDPLPVGTVLSLRFQLTDGPHHEIDGRVVWCHTSEAPGAARISGMGVEFARHGSTARLARELDELHDPRAGHPGESRRG